MRAVTGGPRGRKPRALGYAVEHVGQRRQQGLQRVAAVGSIARIKNTLFSIHQHGLDRGGTKVKPQIQRPVRLTDIGTGQHAGGGVPLAKAGVFFVIGKHTGQCFVCAYLGHVRKPTRQYGQLGQAVRLGRIFGRNGAVGRTNGCRALGMGQVGEVLGRKIEISDKQLFQLWQKVQRPAQKSHLASNGPAAGKATDGLFNHCLKNGRRDIFARHTAVEQGHNVCFGKYTATRGNGIQGGVA